VRGSTIVGAEALLTNAIGGTYLLSVMDESGCEIEREVVLSTPPEIVISATVTDATCFGEIDGEIDVRASGGAMGTTVFSYAWSIGPNVAGSRVRRLQAGAYTVTVTDIMNCSNSETFRVREPDPIAVNLISQPATQGCNGSVTAAVTGGTAPYSYTWNSPQTGPTINNLCPGSYMVQVVDSRGCKPQLPTEAGLVADRRFPCFESSLVITPNGDGANDQLVINCINEFPNNRLQVFNRWGQLVFERQNYDNTWGGTDRGGNVLPEGAYYFVLEYTDPDRNPVQLKGSFTLLLDR
jgi:gliding motility-associated-like protein